LHIELSVTSEKNSSIVHSKTTDNGIVYIEPLIVYMLQQSSVYLIR